MCYTSAIELREKIMARKISAKNLAVMIPASLFFNASVGLSTAYFSELPFLGPFLLANLFCHIPMSLAVSDAIRQELGLKSPTQITGNWMGRSGNKITVNKGQANSKDIFMLLMPGTSSHDNTGLAQIEELKSITVTVNDEDYEISLHKLEEFIYGVARRQSQRKSGLSRRYWTLERKPRMSTQDYGLLMTVLENINGLIVNRSERKSGYLSVSPRKALELIQTSF